MNGKVGIKGYDSFVKAEDDTQDLNLELSVRVNAFDYAAYTDKFLKELQMFLDERE